MSETGRDVPEQYIETPVGSLAQNKFVTLTEVNLECSELQKKDTSKEPFNYMLEVYMDEIQYQLHHAANAIMTGIHDVFLPDKDYKEDAISPKKFLKKEAAWETIKNVLGFEFDRNPGEHTIWLTEDRRTDILTKLKSGLEKESTEKRVSPLNNFEPILQN